MRKKKRVIIDCACGCGEQLENLDKKARPRKYIKNHFKSNYWSGKKFTKSHIDKIKIARDIQEKTKGSPSWKGGRSKTTNGYIRLWKPNHPLSRHGHVLEHRFIMEQVIGRSLLPGEVVHHKNQNKLDNRVENLELFESHSKHMSKGKHEKINSIQRLSS